ncbi:MAG: alpha/beta fold hydrolase [Actinomycetota bacterium]
MALFERGSYRLSFESIGGPEDRTVVFLHGLLLSGEMMEPIARAFSERFRVVNLELHGHGRSSKPEDAASYSMREFALDVGGLANHLGCERFALFGTSLGADVALQTMLDLPERVVAGVLEMPVLDRGARFARRIFSPVAKALRSGHAPGMVTALSKRVPSWPPGFPEAAALLAENPVAGAAVIEGVLAEAMRERWDDVSRCPVPALVIGHRFDPLHAYADAARIARHLPNARLIRARSVLELRLKPGRLLAETIEFIEHAFDERST